MTFLARTRAAWGADAPEWIVALAQACDSQSQVQVAKRLGYSPATVSYVLARKYPGALGKIERTVRGALLDEKIDCPVLAAIPVHECLRNQSAKFSAASPLSVQLWRACQSCPHSREPSERTASSRSEALHKEITHGKP